MPLVMIQNFDEFVKEHGGEYVAARGWLLFPDGWSCDESFMVRRVPPRNEHDRLDLQREFVQIKLREAVNDFQRFKNAAMQQLAHAYQTGNVPSPHPETPRALAQRREDILALRKRIAELDGLIANTPEAQKQRALDAAEKDRQQTIATLARAIEAVEI